MGNGIAHTFAQNGFKVNLIDISEAALKKGIETISKNLDRQVAKDLVSDVEKNETLLRIKPITDLKEGVTDVDLVVEAASENLKIKLEIFRNLDAYCKPSCILASNTSSISITQIAASTKRPELVEIFSYSRHTKRAFLNFKNRVFCQMPKFY